MRTRVSRSIVDFEETHGQTKLRSLERSIALERAKLEALADVQDKVVIERRQDCCVRFAVIGDRHTGSLYHHTAALKEFYDYCHEQGIELVLDVGDILTGHHVFRGHEFEVRDLGLDAQLERLAKDAPRNIKTKFITGNHDASFKNLAGVPVGKLIAGIVPEYEFLGEEHGRVQFETPNGKLLVDLIHPGGGTAYALSYKPQKIVESLEGGTKPDVLLVGHYHKAEFIPSYRNVAVAQVGTFEKQTPFMKRNGLAAHVGGWIVEVTVGKGTKRVKAEFVAFYV